MAEEHEGSQRSQRMADESSQERVEKATDQRASGWVVVRRKEEELESSRQSPWPVVVGQQQQC